MKNIVLVGMMGSGKSTVGTILSKKLTNHNFIDIDELIQSKEKRSINEIFSMEGESYFRSIESEIARELSSLSSLIVSTGGGIIKDPENIKYLKENGLVFYLSANADCICERVKDSKGRPLLNVSNIKNTVDKLLNERVNLYKTADYEIDTNLKSPEEIADEIIEIYTKNE